MQVIKKYWGILVSVVAAIIGLIFLRQFFQKDLKAKLNNAEAAGKDAVLNEKLSNLSAQEQELRAKQDAAKRDLAKQASQLDPNSVKDYWNKN